MTKFDQIPKGAMYQALRYIYEKEGIVCDMFELCGPKGSPEVPEPHPACSSSYNSWAIADMVLHYEDGKHYPFDKEKIEV